MRAHAAHLKIVIQINSCLPEQLLPGNWITDEENSVLPGNFGIGPSFFFARAPVLFYSNPQGRYGRGGQFCSNCESTLTVDNLQILRIFSSNLRHPALKILADL